MNQTHVFPPYFRKIRSNIILPSAPRSSEFYLPLSFTYKNFVCISHIYYKDDKMDVKEVRYADMDWICVNR